jgi:hypothetical protein
MADWTELALLGPTFGWFALAWLYCAWCLAACTVLDQARTGQAPGQAHNQVSAINHAGAGGWCSLDFPGLSGLCVPGLELAWLLGSLAWFRWAGASLLGLACLRWAHRVGWPRCAGPGTLLVRIQAWLCLAWYLAAGAGGLAWLRRAQRVAASSGRASPGPALG